jgi:hypothetical protein
MKFDEICELCKIYSWGNAKTGMNPIDTTTRMVKSVAGERITKDNIGNLFENFKTDIISSLSSKIDFLHIKRKEVVDKAMVVFFPMCRENHPLSEFPRDIINICGIFDLDHPTKDCPSLPGLKVVYKGGKYATSSLNAMETQRQWKPQTTTMIENFFPQFPYLHNQTWNTSILLQPLTYQ